MIQNTTGFSYNGIHSSAMPIAIKNTSLDKGMHSETILTNRKIKEVKIPGRSNPYLYDVESSPLAFKMTISLEEPTTIANIRYVLRWLLNETYYKELIFDSDLTKIYPAIFIGSPKFTYVGDSDNLIGYITLDVRCMTSIINI